MKRLTLLAAWLVCAAVAGQNSSAALDGITLGNSVTKLLAPSHAPDVETTDVGTVWTFDSSAWKMRLTTDDDGIVRMVDLLPKVSQPQHAALDVSEKLTLQFNETSDDALKVLPAPEFNVQGSLPDSGEWAAFRGYRLSSQQELVLLFDAQNRLREAFLGDRDALGRSGLLPHQAGTGGPRFTAPVLQREGTADYPAGAKQGTAFVRLVVDASGAVQAARIFASSGDPTLDDVALRIARNDVFTPGRLDGAPVSAIVFRKEDFHLVPQH